MITIDFDNSPDSSVNPEDSPCRVEWQRLTTALVWHRWRTQYRPGYPRIGEPVKVIRFPLPPRRRPLWKRLVRWH